jgi:hypothetical protein
VSLTFDDMEPEEDYGLNDWLEQLLEETWLEFLEAGEEEMHEGEDADELDE